MHVGVTRGNSVNSNNSTIAGHVGVTRGNSNNSNNSTIAGHA